MTKMISVNVLGSRLNVLIPANLIEDEDRMVCVYCDSEVAEPYCGQCMEYKGLMTIPEWEQYTNEIWED